MITSMRSRLPYVAFGLAAGLLVNATVALAWTGPTDSAPNSNISAPVNVGTTAQIKNGDFGVNNISAFGNALLSGLGVGTGRYLNFDYTSAGTAGTGSSGYGIRDNAGTLEFKNNGGSWSSLQSTISALAGGQWTTSGSNIYSSNVGNVGIGTTDPQQKLDVQGGAIRQVMSSTYDVWLQGGASTGGGDNRNLALLGVDEDSGDTLYVNYGGEYAGGTYITGNVYGSAFLYYSDAKLKENVRPFQGGLSKVLALAPVMFDWKAAILDTAKAGTRDIGLIAQDVEKVVPEIVYEDSNGLKSVDYIKLVPILAKAIQEQQREIGQLKDRLDALEAKAGSR